VRTREPGNRSDMVFASANGVTGSAVFPTNKMGKPVLPFIGPWKPFFAFGHPAQPNGILAHTSAHSDSRLKSSKNFFAEVRSGKTSKPSEHSMAVDASPTLDSKSLSCCSFLSLEEEEQLEHLNVGISFNLHIRLGSRLGPPKSAKASAKDCHEAHGEYNVEKTVVRTRE